MAPSLVVESSPARFQAIWLLDAPCADVPLVEGINKTIALCYGADAAACDRPRVLRLPGFANLKYADRPKARLVVCKPELRYTMGQLEAVFPPQLQATPRITGVPYSADAPSWLALVFRALVDYLQAHDARPRPTSDGGILARCPLHQDHNPSLSLHPERGWKCFAGCGQGRLTLLAYKLGLQVPQGDSHE
ncbi:MAG: hypothetical protein HYY01_00685 [Chloroflexi bacterium]|nr:hypothetical protein [Chloroflexota bacterium]